VAGTRAVVRIWFLQHDVSIITKTKGAHRCIYRKLGGGGAPTPPPPPSPTRTRRTRGRDRARAEDCEWGRDSAALRRRERRRRRFPPLVPRVHHHHHLLLLLPPPRTPPRSIPPARWADRCPRRHVPRSPRAHSSLTTRGGTGGGGGGNGRASFPPRTPPPKSRRAHLLRRRVGRGRRRGGRVPLLLARSGPSRRRCRCRSGRRRPCPGRGLPRRLLRLVGRPPRTSRPPPHLPLHPHRPGRYPRLTWRRASSFLTPARGGAGREAGAPPGGRWMTWAAAAAGAAEEEEEEACAPPPAG
jgi:hypothetical protein